MPSDPGRTTASSRRAPKRRRNPNWDDVRLRKELTEFIAGRDEWPSWAEFARAGRGRLREKVNEHGGPEHWAAELGVRFVHRKPGHAPRWTEARVRDELREFLHGRTEWPERQVFEAAGRKGLRDAVSRLGGVDRWAAEFALPRPHLKSGSHLVYDEARIEAELRRFLGDRGEWPSVKEFRAAGLGPLVSAIYRSGGKMHWAGRMGVTVPERLQPKRSPPRVWTHERILAELTRVCDMCGGWPGADGFKQAGSMRAYQAASRNGGIGRWRRELGLAEPSKP